MQFNLVFKDVTYSLCIGYDTAVHKQMHFISLCKLWHDNQGKVYNGRELFRLFKHKKYK